jgi:hypothetical protein
MLGTADTNNCLAFRLPLVKVNPDGPLLDLTAALSIATLTQEPGRNGSGIQRRKYVNWICENVC